MEIGTRAEFLFLFLDASNDTVIYVLSALLVCVIAAIIIAALMIHQKSRVSYLLLISYESYYDS